MKANLSYLESLKKQRKITPERLNRHTEKQHQPRSDLENKSLESRSSFDDDSRPSSKHIPNSTPLMSKTRKNLGEVLVLQNEK